MNRLMLIWLFAIACFSAAAGAAPTTFPASPPTGLDAATWERMTKIDQRAQAIVDLSADFEQQKFTPLLKKPMTSSGTVKAKGAAMFWDTRAPSPTLMRVDEKQISLYYPQQKTLEIYPIAGDLAALASSPLPHLSMLLDHFKFAPSAAKDMGAADDDAHLALRLTPLDEDIRKHIDHVTVLIDAGHGFILAFELIDGDGERTVIHFSNVKTNTGMPDDALQIALPAGTKTVHPLENLRTPPGANSGTPSK